MAMLASCSNNLKIWDVSRENTNSLGNERIFSPHSSLINCLAWSYSNQVIATGGKDGVLAFTQISSNGSGNITTLSQQISEPYEINSIGFNSNSRFLCCGGTDFNIHIWDLKKRSIVKSFKNHNDSVTCVKFNDNDTYIASGSADGQLLLNSTTANHVYSLPFGSANHELYGIRDLKYSPMKKNILSACNEEGSIYLWDVNTVSSSGNSKSILSTFQKQHHAPCTSLAFSTVNHLLLSTAGLDKRIYFYDISDKRVVKSISTEAPCTCISFNDDGVTIAVGTSHGNILLYDLRYITSTSTTLNLSNTMQMISAHSPLSVNYLSFQNSDKTKPKVSKGEDSSLKDSNSVINAAPQSTLVPPKTTTISKPSIESKTLANDILSPLKTSVPSEKEESRIKVSRLSSDFQSKNEVVIPKQTEIEEVKEIKTIPYSSTKSEKPMRTSNTDSDISQLLSQVKEEFSHKLEQTSNLNANKFQILENELKSVHSELKSVHQTLNLQNNLNSNSQLDSQVQNLHLEVIRQSQLLQNFMETLFKQQTHLMQENENLKQENRKLRNELQKFV